MNVDWHGEFEEIDVFGTGALISWRPTCSKKWCNDHPLDSAIFLSKVCRRIDLERDVLEPLLRESRKETVNTLIVPALDHSCSSLKTADMDLDEGMSKKKAGVRALVFYRRHSDQLDGYMDHRQMELYENVCSYIPDILRNAGCSVLSE